MSASPVSSGKPHFLSQSTPSPASTSVNTAALIVPQRRKSTLLHVFPDLNVLGGLSNSSPSQHMQRLNSAAISAGLQNLPTFSRRNSMLNNNNDAPSTFQHYRGLTADDQHGGGLIIPPHSRKSSILGDNLSIASHLQSKPSLRRLSSDDHHGGITVPQRARKASLLIPSYVFDKDRARSEVPSPTATIGHGFSRPPSGKRQLKLDNSELH